jgi:hypothetical protein
VIALGLVVLGVAGVVAIGRSQGAKPSVSMPKAMLYDLGSHTKDAAYKLKAVTQIGRQEKNDIVIPFDTVSGYHAEIQFHDGQFYLCDLKSSNKTFLDGQALIPNEEVLLKHGNRIRFDAYEFEFVREDQKHFKKTVVAGQGGPKRTVPRAEPPGVVPPKPAQAPSPEPVREQPVVDAAEVKTKVKPGKCPKHKAWDAKNLCPQCKEAIYDYCLSEMEKEGQRLCKDCAKKLEAA